MPRAEAARIAGVNEPLDRGPALHDTRAAHLVRAGLVGVLAGLLAVVFRWSLAESEHLRGKLLAQLHTSGHILAWLVLPLIGLVAGCFVGWLVLRFSPDARGSGIPHIKGVLVHLRQLRWPVLLPVKFIGGVIGIGAGLSLGREGPTVQMGAGVGQAIADILRVPQRSVPQLLSCGAGAGLAAAFNAPLAGFLFVIEELHRELSARTFAGALIAALAADIVTRALSGDAPSFTVSAYPSIPLSALPIAAALGAAGGILGVTFNRALLYSARGAARLSALPAWMRPGIAAAACGVVAWWLPDAAGGGHTAADNLLRHHIVLSASGLALLLLVKFALTVVSYASGAPGGIFAPMLLMGVLLGTICGQVVSQTTPSLADHATAFAILGMAAVFTGSVRAPLTAIVLIIELTANYQQLLALGVTCLVADLTASALRDVPIYEALLTADLRASPGANAESKEPAEPRSVYIGIQRNSALEGRTIRESRLPDGCLVVAVERAGKELLPTAGLTLLPGDHITVLVPSNEAEKVMAIVRLATGL